MGGTFARYGEFVVHSLVNEGEPRVSFICLTGERFPQQLAFRYLNKLRQKFLLKYRSSMFDKASTVRCKLASTHTHTSSLSDA